MSTWCSSSCCCMNVSADLAAVADAAASASRSPLLSPARPSPRPRTSGDEPARVPTQKPQTTDEEHSADSLYQDAKQTHRRWRGEGAWTAARSPCPPPFGGRAPVRCCACFRFEPVYGERDRFSRGGEQRKTRRCWCQRKGEEVGICMRDGSGRPVVGNRFRARKSNGKLNKKACGGRRSECCSVTVAWRRRMARMENLLTFSRVWTSSLCCCPSGLMAWVLLPCQPGQ
jgi:hypothetical protein